MDNRSEESTWLVQYDLIDRTLVIGTDGRGGSDGEWWIEYKKFLGSFFKIHIARLIKMLEPMYFQNIPQMILNLLMPCHPTWESMIQAKNMVDLCQSVNKEPWMVTDIRPKHYLGRNSYGLEISDCPGLKHWERMQSLYYNLKPITKLFNTFCQQFHTFHLSSMGKSQYSQNI